MWYLITKNNNLVGVTKDNPYLMDLPADMSISEFEGKIPDLNYYDWDNELVEFVQRQKILTKLEFYSRFQLAESVAIETSTDPILKVLQKQQTIAEYIDLNDPDTLQGVGYLYNTGIITMERMLEILT